jgi:hypothetical protein
MVYGVCVLCRRPIRDDRFAVNFDSTIGRPVAPEVVGDGTGLMPVGPRCRRRLPTGWAVQWLVPEPAEK